MNEQTKTPLTQTTFRNTLEGNTVTAYGKTVAMGSYTFPLLPEGWVVTATKLALGAAGREIIDTLQVKAPSMRMIKDDGVMDIFAGLSFEDFQEVTGIHVRKIDDPRTCKRLSRVFRPSKWFGVFPTSETKEKAGCKVVELKVDTDLWDGANWISESFAYGVLGLPLKARRFEGTVMNKKGQAKGHFFVVPDGWMDGQIGVPVNSWKKEIYFGTGHNVFVDMRPFYGHAHLLGDIQTVVNIYSETFTQADFMGWLHEQSEAFLTAIRTGECEDRMQYVAENSTIEQLEGYSVFEFVASGGRLHQSATMTKQFGKTWTNRLTRFMGGAELEKGLSLPIKGGFRVYLVTDQVMGMSLESGLCHVSFKDASIIVSSADYKRVAGILGGGDQDDAINCIWDGVSVICSRNPNGRGEFVRLTLANPEELEKHHVEQVHLKWNVLDTIKSKAIEVELPKVEQPKFESYMDYVSWLMFPVSARIGTLGQHVNVLTAYVLTHGTDAPGQPALLEQVIDACAKDLTVDLSDVRAWDKMMAAELAKSPLCGDAIRRLKGLLTKGYPFIKEESHWLDSLTLNVSKHIAWYQEQVKHLADAATPPAPVYGDSDTGAYFRNTYNYFMKSAITSAKDGIPDDTDFDDARVACEKILAEAQDPFAMLISAYSLSGFGGSDACVWQKGIIAENMMHALRLAGVLGYLTDLNGVIEHTEVGVQYPLNHIKVNGVWFNVWPGKPANATKDDMNNLPKEKRTSLKNNIHANADKLVERKLTFKMDGDRQTCWNDQGKMLGYIQKGHEDRTSSEMVVVATSSDDGNLLLVVL